MSMKTLQRTILLAAVAFGAVFAGILLAGCAPPVNPPANPPDPPDTTPCGEVSGLVATPKNLAMLFSWTPPADSDLARIEILVNGMNYASTTVCAGPFKVMGLAGGTPIDFTVKTVDTTGNVSAGIPVTATPIQPPDWKQGSVPAYYNKAHYGVTMASQNIAWAVGESGTILKTENGGDTWTAQSSGVTTKLLAVDAVAASTAWAVGERDYAVEGSKGPILKTVDGGTTWAIQDSGTVANVTDIDFWDANLGLACCGAGQVLRTTDGGATWTAVTVTGLGVWSLKTVRFVTATVVYALGADKAVYKSADAGATWSKLATGSTCALNDIAFVDANTGWAVGGEWGMGGMVCVILKTTDGGATWTAQDSPVTQELFSCAFVDANRGYIAGNFGLLLVTTDGGETWTDEIMVNNTLRAVRFFDADHGVYVGSSGLIFRYHHE